MIGAGFEKLDFDKNHLVVETLELFEECIDERNGFSVGVFLKIESDKTGFKILAEEGTSLGDGPFDARSGNGNLYVKGIGDSRKEVNKLTD